MQILKIKILNTHADYSFYKKLFTAVKVDRRSDNLMTADRSNCMDRGKVIPPIRHAGYRASLTTVSEWLRRR